MTTLSNSVTYRINYFEDKWDIHTLWILDGKEALEEERVLGKPTLESAKHLVEYWLENEHGKTRRDACEMAEAIAFEALQNRLNQEANRDVERDFVGCHEKIP